MSLDTVKLYLNKAGIELNEHIASCLSPSNGTTPDYDAIERYLAFSRRIESLKTEFGVVISQKHSISCENRVRNTVNPNIDYLSNSPQHRNSNSAANEFPLYFFSKQKLYKIGKRTDGSGSLYKKAVPIDDVIVICRCIASMTGRGPVATTELESSLHNMPTYKIQVTTMALIKAKVLTEVGRGKYKLRTDVVTSPDDWIGRLRNLEERRDLLEMV